MEEIPTADTPTQWIAVWSEVFRAAIDLETADADPSKPYDKKYEARALWEQAYDACCDWLSRTESEPSADEQEAIQGIRIECCLRLGMNFMECEELSRGAEWMKSAEEHVDEFSSSSKVSYSLRVYQQYGILFTRRQQSEQAFEYLGKAKALYESIGADDRGMEVEAEHTKTLFFLAQVCQHLGKPADSAMYCHQTLQRQLHWDSENLDKMEFANNCIFLAGYYMNNLQFALAHHCLCAAVHMIPEEHKGKLDPDASDPIWANFQLATGRLYLTYLRSSVEMPEELDRAAKEEDDEAKQLYFQDLPVDQKHPSDFPLISTFAAAVPVYQKVVQRLLLAQKYYNMDSCASDFADIQRDLAEVYRFLSNWEADLDRRFAMEGKRQEYLRVLLEKYNPTVYDNVLKQAAYDCADSAMAQFNIRCLQRARHVHDRQAIPAHCLPTKINDVAMKSLRYFQLFTSYFEMNAEQTLQIPDEHAFAYLTAKLGIARLYTRMMCGGQAELKARQLGMALKVYEWIKDHKDVFSGKFEDECSMAEQMSQLLPLKIARIHANGVPSNVDDMDDPSA